MDVEVSRPYAKVEERIFITTVEFVLLHGYETWTMTHTLGTQLDVTPNSQDCVKYTLEPTRHIQRSVWRVAKTHR